MSGWGTQNGSQRIYGGVITSFQVLGAYNGTAIASAAAWQSANYAVFVPFRLELPVTIYKITVGMGTLTGGNFDVGIYDAAGNRLVSSGATARAGGSTEQTVDITDTLIGPGLFYMAMSADGTNNYITIPVGTGLQVTKMAGVLGQTSAYTLPATATFASASQTRIPQMALHVRPY